MIFQETPLPGAYVVELERTWDERGFFARAWCQREFAERGLTAQFVQTNVAYSRKKGTLRGLHYQAPPYQEAKLVRCTAGRAYDVVVDLRRDSPTYRRWFGVELAQATYRMLFVPEGFAHGYLTLEDETEITYQVSQFYAPGFERGIRYDDPALAIAWPGPIEIVSAKDRSWEDFAG
ncbi:MAG: dTDP-4-dehydrorhamnose 3,5-epimerase [Armatimonadota bacterium]|nr:dTDP-4-dehydrorhamnose 3,5-epimerase [Armatimonadota bacterium]